MDATVKIKVHVCISGLCLFLLVLNEDRTGLPIYGDTFYLQVPDFIDTNLLHKAILYNSLLRVKADPLCGYHCPISN